ncbi:MAG: SprT family zinc-dependent metalloprotease, partial [Hyphomicrobiales bacterium]
FRGEKYRLQASGALRGRVQSVVDDDHMNTLLVPGDSQHFERRLTDWLKKQAREDITKACIHHANNLGLHYRSITIRDQRTRWGSCSSGGRLNFSWRLILAPMEVLDYVAAHEVAHLEEMNHQPQFWRLVEKTCPNMQEHRNWLRNNGHELHQYGS